MKNVTSRPWTSSVVALAAVASFAVIGVLSAQVAEAAQAEARVGEGNMDGRVRAELEAKMSQLRAQLEELAVERALNLEALQRQIDVEASQRRIEATAVNEARLHQLYDRAARARFAEAGRRAGEMAEAIAQRAQRVHAVALRNCDLFGERVLDHTEELGLSGDQVDQIRAAQRAGRRDDIERRADIEVAEMDLEGLYEADEPDLGAIRAKLEELAMLQVDDQIAGLTLRRQVRQILTPSQLEEWDDMSDEGDVHVVVSGSSTMWSRGGWSNFGRFGC